MKKIEAIIRPEDLDKVRISLQEIGIIGMTGYIERYTTSMACRRISKNLIEKM